MKSFTKIYEEVLVNSKQELENLRKKLLFRLFILISITICLVVVCFMYTSVVKTALIGYLAIVVCIFIIRGPQNEYKSKYKEKVVKTFIKSYDDNLSYTPEGKIPSQIYRSAGFETNYDRYHSDDLIIGNIDGHKIMMGEVHTEIESEHTDSDGNTTTTYVTIFHGMFGNVHINNKYNGEIKVHSNKGKLGNLFSGKKRIEMDSAEFEKYFDVYADDKIQAMQILTSDIMEQMINFITENKIKFEITINQSEFYIRFKTGQMFEANVFKSSVNFDTLKNVYDIINFTFDITRNLIKITEETEI